MKKNNFTNHHIDSGKDSNKACNSMFIKISHYNDDKLLKTETFPMVHFLESFTNEFEKIRYN